MVETPAVDDAAFMRLALEQAELAVKHHDVPVGAVLVEEGEVLATAHNERELTGDPTAHAEILCLRRASSRRRSWRLAGTTLYSTVEPCPMCAGAIVAARVTRLVYGTPDSLAGAALSVYNIVQDPRMSHRCALTTGVLAEECAGLITRFFEEQRRPARFL